MGRSLILCFLLAGCAGPSTFWGSGANFAWVRPGTGIQEATADMEVCAELLREHELLPTIATSIETVTLGWYIARASEFASRLAYRRCMQDMGYLIKPIQ